MCDVLPTNDELREWAKNFMASRQPVNGLKADDLVAFAEIAIETHERRNGRIFQGEADEPDSWDEPLMEAEGITSEQLRAIADGPGFIELR